MKHEQAQTQTQEQAAKVSHRLLLDVCAVCAYLVTVPGNVERHFCLCPKPCGRIAFCETGNNRRAFIFL